MHYSYRAVLIATLLVALLMGTGCATLSEAECHTANWYRLGQKDGNKGYERARLYDHADACAPYGIRPDPNAYYAGRKLGLDHYCTPQGGYRAGLDGHPYRDVCPPTAEPAFLAEYRQGKAIHDAEKNIERAERNISSLERQLDKDDISSDTRSKLHRQLRSRLDDLRRYNHELIQLHRLHGRY